jgi:iron complex outermembrane receptor protein
MGGAAAVALLGVQAGAAMAQATNLSGVEVSTAPVPGFVAHGATTVSKTDTPLIELPRSVSIVTADEMQTRGVSNEGQIFAYSAGINSDNYGGTPLSRVYSNVRGFVSLHYLDGLKMTDFWYGMEPYGLERAELLKGPPSALIGQSNPGGILNLVSKRPTDTPIREIQLQYGNFHRIQIAGDISGPLTKDGKLLFRLTAMARDSDTILGSGTQDNRVYVAPALMWKATPKTDITLLGSYQWDPHITNFQFLPRVGTVDQSPFGLISRKTFAGEPNYDNSTKAQSQIAYLVEHRFTDWLTLRQNTRYTYFDLHQQFLQGGAVAANQRTQSRTAVLADFIINIWNADTNLNARFDTGPLKHNVLVGADYAYVPSYQGQGTAAGPTLDLFAPAYGAAVITPVITTKRQQHLRQTGLYLQDQIKLGDLSLLLGVRHDHATVTTRNRNALTGLVTSFVRQHDDAWTGQAGAIYKLPGGLAPYVSWSRSFAPTPGTDFFGQAFLPSTGEQIEGGVKFQPTSLNAFVTASVFDLKQDNVRTNDLAHPGFAIQTGQVRSRGFEIEGKASLSKLNLTASYTSMSNKVTRSTTATLGKITQGRPKHQTALWADYAFVPALTIGGGVRYMGSAWGDPNNTFKTESYTLFDALVRLNLEAINPTALKGWDFSVNAINLGDTRYVANCDAATQCFYGSNRSVKGTLRRRW